MNFYRHTNAETACEMVNVTDKDILGWSNGEVVSSVAYPDYVNFLCDCDEEGATEEEIAEAKETVKKVKALYSESIFGSYKEKSMKMGHIALPVSIVNINYFMGARPVLAKKLGRPFNEVKDIINGKRYIAVNTKEGLYKTGEYVNIKEVIVAVKEGRLTSEEYAGDVKGFADAIEYLLREKNDPDIDKIILRNIPVIPARLRYTTTKNEDGVEEMGGYRINSLYRDVVSQSGRLRRLTELITDSSEPGLNLILRNERAVLQQRVDALINNGYSDIKTDYSGEVIESLREMYLIIQGRQAGPSNDLEKIIEKAKKNLDRNAFRKALLGMFDVCGTPVYPDEPDSPRDSKITEDEERAKILDYVTCFADLTDDIADTYYYQYSKHQRDIMSTHCDAELLNYITDQINHNDIHGDEISDDAIDKIVEKAAACADSIFYYFSRKGLAYVGMAA